LQDPIRMKYTNIKARPRNDIFFWYLISRYEKRKREDKTEV
jgi:hypothetical protein